MSWNSRRDVNVPSFIPIVRAIISEAFSESRGESCNSLLFLETFKLIADSFNFFQSSAGTTVLFFYHLTSLQKFET